jgi:TonB-linked SusC/RagA family outer membrane protein
MSKLRRLFAMFFAVALIPAALPAQQGSGMATVTGRVTSDAGAPLSGAAVFMPTLNIGTITRQDGSYVLVVPPGRVQVGQQVTVTAQLIGYRSTSRQVPLSTTEATQLDFTLATDVLQLEGIVATGIGQTVTRDRLGVSIASVGGEELTRVQSTNVVTAMAGKAPNVEITQASGDPGASSYIRIRGVNTIIGTGQPLFVIDGVPVDNSENHLPTTTRGGRLANTNVPNRASDINPNDIASIEILKGAAAAAIYGARAANGVVLITTRSGMPGTTRASLHTTVTTDRVVGQYPQQMTFGHGTAGTAAGRGAGLRAWGPALPAGTQTFDQFATLFESGGQVDATMSLSGATERTTYYLSLGRMSHEGVIWGGSDFYNRNTARLKGSHRLLENFNVTGNFAYSETDGSFVQRGSNVNGLLLGALRTPPEFNNREFETEEGFHRNYTNTNPYTGARPANIFQAGTFANPFWTIVNNRTTSEVGRAWGNVGLEYAPMPWLNLTYTLGKDYANDERLDVMPWGNTTLPRGWMAKGQFVTNNTDHNLIGTATHTLNENADGSLTLGYNRNSREWRRYYTEGTTIVAPGVNLLDNTVVRTPNELQEYINAESFFGQATANLAGQLFLTAALRNDGFSTFGQSQPRHFYPKLSGAWEFTRYLEDALPAFNFGKLRAAWGQAGNEPPAYGTLGVFTAATIVDAGWTTEFQSVYQGRGGLRSGTTMAQPDLRPERTSEMEFGADLSFLNNRVGLGVTWYDAHTRDGIFFAPLAPSSGFSFQLQNVAEIQNRGVELTLDLRPIETPTVALDLGLNWARNRNEVLTLGGTTEFIYMGGQSFAGATGSATVGHPVGALRGNDFARCGQDTRQLIVDACAAAGNPAGAVYVGADGWPILDPQERVIGHGHPDWTAGVRGMLTLFQNLQVSTVVDVMQGNQIWNGTKGAQYNYGMHADTERRGERVTYANYAGVETVGPGANTPFEVNQAWYMGIGGGFGPVASQFMEDGSYVKLREVALNFSVPARFTQRAGLSGLDLRVAGRNLATWTNYTGLDPETNLGGNTNVRGIDYYNHPQIRSLIFTVGVNR